MSIRKINIKKLPASESYILSLKEIKKIFDTEFNAGLFMTNDSYEHDSIYKKKTPIINGTVVCSISMSYRSESEGEDNSIYLHFYKIKKDSLNSNLKDLFISKIVPGINSWIKKSKRTVYTKRYTVYIVSLVNNNFQINTIEC